MKTSVKILLSMFVVATVDGSFDHKHPQCSKEWIRYLVLNACNYSKRHIAMVQYMVEESIKDLQLKFNETMSYHSHHESRISGHGVSGSRRTNKRIPSGAEQVENKLLFPQPTNLKMKAQKENRKDESRSISSSNSLLDISSFDLLMEMEQEVWNEEVWKRRTRSIKTLVERCCIKLCKEEDFKVLCFV